MLKKPYLKSKKKRSQEKGSQRSKILVCISGRSLIYGTLTWSREQFCGNAGKYRGKSVRQVEQVDTDHTADDTEPDHTESSPDEDDPQANLAMSYRTIDVRYQSYSDDEQDIPRQKSPTYAWQVTH